MRQPWQVPSRISTTARQPHPAVLQLRLVGGQPGLEVLLPCAHGRQLLPRRRGGGTLRLDRLLERGDPALAFLYRERLRAQALVDNLEVREYVDLRRHV